MKQINHNGYLLQEVPEGQNYFHIYGNEFRQEIRYNNMVSPGKFRAVPIELPKGNWNIISKADAATEEMAKGICPQVRSEEFLFNDFATRYKAGNMGYTKTALESFYSLLRHHGLSPETTLILKQINQLQP